MNRVSVRVVRSLVDAAQRAGASRAAVLGTASIAPGVLDDLDGSLSRSDFHRLVPAILELTRDPAFGLHCIRHLTPLAFNPVTDLVFHAPDLRQSMSSLQKFGSRA